MPQTKPQGSSLGTIPSGIPAARAPPTLTHGHFPRGYNDTIACEHRSRRSVHHKGHPNLKELPQVPAGPRRRASPNCTPLTHGHSRDDIRNTTICEHPAYRRLVGSSMSALDGDCDGVLGGLSISGLGSTLACYTKVGKDIRSKILIIFTLFLVCINYDLERCGRLTFCF